MPFSSVKTFSAFLLVCIFVISQSVFANDEISTSNRGDISGIKDLPNELNSARAGPDRGPIGGGGSGAPGVPSGLSGPSTSNTGNYLLTWNQPSGVRSYTEYIIQESVNGGSWYNYGLTDHPTLSYSISGKSNGTYLYRIQACNNSCSGFSGPISVEVRIPPSTPSAPNNINSTSTTFTVSWSQPSGAVSYYQVQERVGSGSWTTITTSHSSTSITRTKSNNTDYSYRVSACNNTSWSCSGYSGGNSVKVRVKPSTPSTPGNINSTSTSYTVSWGAPSGTTTYYVIQEKVGSGGWGTITSSHSSNSISRTGVDGTDYQYRTYACNQYSWACSSYSGANSVKVRLKPATPSVPNAASTNTTSSMNVSWSKPSGRVSYYDVEKRNNGGGWSQGIYGTGSLSGSIGGLSDGSWDFHVRACNDYSWACSSYSNDSSNTTVRLQPGTPSTPSAPSTSTGSATISWPSVSGATYYDLQKRLNNGSWQTGSNGISGTSKTLTGLTDGAWDYRVRACNTYSWSCSAYSSISADTTVRVIPSTPAGPTSPSTSTGSAAVSWSGIPNATYYDVQKRLNSGSWQTAKNGDTNTSETINSLTDGTWTFRLRACNGYSWACSSFGAASSNTAVRLIPSTPSTPTAPSTSTGSATISWSSISGATYYDLQKRLNNGNWQTGSNGISSNSTTLNGLTNGAWDFRIRACNTYSWSCSAYSSISADTTVRSIPSTPAAPSSPSTSTGSAAVSWSSVSNATYYDVQKRLGSGSWQSAINGDTNTSETINSLTDGNWTFRLRACNGYSWACSSFGAASSNTTVKNKPNTPSAPISPSTSTGSATISWSSVSGATYYDLQKRLNNGSWQTGSNAVSGTSLTLSGLTDGTWDFRIRACNTYSWSCSNYSSVSADTTVRLNPSAPSAPTVPSTSTGSAAVSWNSVAGATYYDIQKRLNSGSWQTAKSGDTNTSETISSLSDGNWTFRLRACNGYSWACSNYGSVSSATEVRLTPTGVNVSVGSATQGTPYSISASASGNVTAWTLSERKQGGSWTTISSTASTNRTKTIPGEVWEYRATACNDWNCVNSPISSVTIQAVTLNDIPDANDFTQTVAAPHDETIGHISPEVSVDGGAVNASFAIEIPPGRAGVQPSVAINYSSDGGHSIVGHGWSLSAGSRVSRCGSFFALDGQSRRVMDDDQDKLCLDGARLVLHNGSISYGLNGAVYSPESSPQVRVTQMGGNLSSTNTWFKVETSSGNQTHYGSNANSRTVRSAGGTVIAWQITKQQDLQAQNNIDYVYDNSSPGHSLITDIYYTGNGSSFGDRRVHFIYASNRPDLRVKYQLGEKELINKLLTTIETYVGNSKVRTYNFNYSVDTSANGQVNRYSRLDNVVACAMDNLGNPVCQLPTDFEYGASNDGWQARVLNTSLPGYGDRLTSSGAGDFDGDGKGDVILGTVTGYGTAVLLSKTQTIANVGVDIGNPYIPFIEQGQSVIGSTNDLDLDGRENYIGYRGIDLGASYWDGTQFQKSYLLDGNQVPIRPNCQNQYYSNTTGAFKDCSVYVFDVNGDSKPDLLVPSQEFNEPQKVDYTLYLNQSTGVTGQFVFLETAYQFTMTNDVPASLGDIDGDGNLDLFSSVAIIYSNRLRVFKTINSSAGFSHFETVDFTAEDLRDIKTADINGDGLTDVFDDYDFYLNTGESFSLSDQHGVNGFFVLRDYTTHRSTVEARDHLRFVDYNQDGLQDILAPISVASEAVCLTACTSQGSQKALRDLDIFNWGVWIAEVTPSGNIEFLPGVSISVAAPLPELAVVDTDGDGYSDIISRLGKSTSDVYNPQSPSTRGVYVHFNQNQETDKLKSFTTGLNLIHEFDYASLASSTDFYNPCYAEQSASQCQQSTQFPYKDLATNYEAIQEYRTSNGYNNELNKTRFKYRKARVHQQGRGVQGFGRIIEEKYDVETASTPYRQVINNFAITFPTKGTLIGRESMARNDSSAWVTIENTTATPASSAGIYAATYSVYVDSSTTLNYELNGSLMSTTSRNNVVDDLGLLSSSTTTQSDGSNEVTLATTETNTYLRDTSAWWFKLDEKTTRKQISYINELAMPVSALRDVTLTETYLYQASNTRAPTQKTVSSSDQNINLITQTAYNEVFNQMSRVTNSSNGTGNQAIEGSRWQEVNYSSDGYFIDSTYNSEWGLTTPVTQVTVDPATGQTELAIDVNGNIVDTQYDAFGQTIRVSTPSTADVTTSLQSCSAVDCSEANGHAAIYRTVTRQHGAPESRTYLDSVGREVFVSTDAINSRTIVAWQAIDRRGRITSAVDAHYAGASPTTYGNVLYSNFDGLDRARHKQVRQHPKDYDVDYTFNGLHQVINVTPQGSGGGYALLMESQSSILGAPLWHKDAKGNYTHFRYDALGNPVLIEDVGGNELTAVYNGIGHKTQLTDPNMGTWDFSYNALGELRRQQDAKAQVTTFNYDQLGRLITRAPQGETASQFFFDENNDLGLLSREQKGTAFQRHYAYDFYKRPSSVTTTIDGNTYVQATAYDSQYGRVKGQQTPDGLVTEYRYNSLGINHQVVDAGQNLLLREIDDLDAHNNIVEQEFASGALTQHNVYKVAGLLASRCTVSAVNTTCNANAVQYLDFETYDSYGNLKKLNNLVIGEHETFAYDNLHRLTQSVRTWDAYSPSTVNATVDYEFDDAGNIRYKTDFSTNNNNAYQYGDSSRSQGNAGPNAVRSIALKGGGSRTYDYDLNGNMLSDGMRTISYGVNNKPETISTSNANLNFYYGSDNLRYKQVKTESGVTTTTHYVGNFEKEFTSTSTTTRSAIGDFALYKVTDGTSSWHFTLRDHMGSVETITDAIGQLEQRRGYDPFGKPRDLNYDDTNNGLLASTITPRGFTNHEHLDSVELIHMNGRAYDYNTGRFLSVDPFIAMPESSQAYNPYSYVMNNPLSYVDPTGYVAEEKQEVEKVEDWQEERPKECDSHSCVVGVDENGTIHYKVVSNGAEGDYAHLPCLGCKSVSKKDEKSGGGGGTSGQTEESSETKEGGYLQTSGKKIPYLNYRGRGRGTELDDYTRAQKGLAPRTRFQNAKDSKDLANFGKPGKGKAGKKVREYVGDKHDAIQLLRQLSPKTATGRSPQMIRSLPDKSGAIFRGANGETITVRMTSRGSSTVQGYKGPPTVEIKFPDATKRISIKFIEQRLPGI